MSLESSVSALVGATNKLTDTVSGKIKEIDDKVDKATASVPNVIRDLTSVAFYIDADIGSDDNDGSESSPLKTISKLSELITNGSSVKLYLRHSQVHEIVGVGPTMATGLFEVRRWGSGDNPLIVWSPEDGKNYGSGFGLNSGVFFSDQVDITARYKGAERLYSTSAFLRYLPGRVDVYMYRGTLSLEDAPFCTTSIAYCQRDLSLRYSEIKINSNSFGDAKVSKAAGPVPGVLKFEGTSLTLPSGVILSDLIDYASGEDSLFTNLVL